MTGTASGTIPAAELLQAYRTMRTIRDFEERVYKEFQTGQMPGFVHLYAGGEAVAAQRSRTSVDQPTVRLAVAALTSSSPGSLIVAMPK